MLQTHKGELECISLLIAAISQEMDPSMYPKEQERGTEQNKRI
jgi:hypothetical protein